MLTLPSNCFVYKWRRGYLFTEWRHHQLNGKQNDRGNADGIEAKNQLCLNCRIHNCAHMLFYFYRPITIRIPVKPRDAVQCIQHTRFGSSFIYYYFDVPSLFFGNSVFDCCPNVTHRIQPPTYIYLFFDFVQSRSISGDFIASNRFQK